MDRQSGRGAVGFKVYDLKGKLKRVSNTFKFDIPADLVKAGYFMTIAHGNGKESIALDPNGVAKNFVPEDRILTGISSVTVDEDNNAATETYDLTGRKAEKAQRGVVIENGKIVIK